MDGLRGVAAIGVLLYHFSTRLHARLAVPHGYLAVDFFFMLSGFVLMHAYGQKLYTRPWSWFLKARLLRILPLSVLGVLVGASLRLLDGILDPGREDTARTLVTAFFNAALLPSPWTTAKAGPFAADEPLWSLSLEMVVNLLWAFLLCRARALALVGLAIAGMMIATPFAVASGSFDIGWNWATYLAGYGRVAFGFFAGVALWHVRPRLSPSPWRPWVAALTLGALLCWPDGGLPYDLMTVCLAFPALLYLAASAEFGQEGGFFRLLGEASYPLYVIHLPCLAVLGWAAKRWGLHPWSHPEIYLLAPAIVVLALILSRFYDRPLRALLSRRRDRPVLAPTPPQFKG